MTVQAIGYARSSANLNARPLRTGLQCDARLGLGGEEGAISVTFKLAKGTTCIVQWRVFSDLPERLNPEALDFITIERPQNREAVAAFPGAGRPTELKMPLSHSVAWQPRARPKKTPVLGLERELE